jgi:hypothetical protein
MPTLLAVIAYLFLAFGYVTLAVYYFQEARSIPTEHRINHPPEHREEGPTPPPA